MNGEIISGLIFNVAVLFVMMIPGIVLKKCNLVPDGFGKGISNLVLYVAQPLLIVCAYISCESRFADIWVNVLVVFILSVIAHVIFTVVAMPLFGKAEEGKRRMLRFATIFANAAFMGIPLIDVVCGAECAIYASIYNITFNLFLWTLGVYLCTRRDGEDMDGDGDSDMTDELIAAHRATKKELSLVKVLLHPVTIASVLGVILLASGANNAVAEELAKESPNVIVALIVDCLVMIKGLVAPLSMVVIGLRLADVNFRGFFNDVHMYVFLALRHLVLPLATLGVCKLLALVGVPISPEVMTVTMILAATPAASSATMFAEKYDCDAVYVSRLVVVSTILCILTIPLVMMLV